MVLGGPQHAFDDEKVPHYPALMQLMRDFDAAGKPVAGICLGCQVLARAFGATVWTMPALEFGFVEDMSLTPAGAADPVVGPVGEVPALMQFHEDTFDLPAGAVSLIEGATCANQCFRVGNCSYGFQFHLEIDSITTTEWFDEFQNDEIDDYAKYRDQFTDAFFDELRGRFPLLMRHSEAYCVAVARNWLRLK